MRAFIIGITMLAASSASAQTSTKWVGKYFCKASAAQGFSYYPDSKEWKGTNFRTNRQMVVSVTQAAKEDQVAATTSLQQGQYQVTIAEMGDGSKPQRCMPEGHYRSDDKTPVKAFDEGYLICTATLTTFKMDLSTMRYLSAYLQGYIDGEDNDNNTPNIEIGTCARLE